MSNMKLYTEIQMLEAIDRAIFSKQDINSFDILEDLTPIELPSDEEIKKETRFKPGQEPHNKLQKELKELADLKNRLLKNVKERIKRKKI